MWYLFLMQIYQSFRDWFRNFFESLLLKRWMLFCIAGERMITEMLHDNVESVLSLVWVNYFDYVRMRNAFQYLYLLHNRLLLFARIHLELIVGFYHTLHSISFSISYPHLRKSSFTNNLVKNVKWILNDFRIFD